MASKPSSIPQQIMSFGEHLEELRRRLIFSLLGIGALFVLFLIFGRTLMELLTAPALDALAAAGQPQTFLATNPVESFSAYIKVAGVMAVLCGMPWILIQLWLFVAPGLYEHERRFAYFLAPMSAVLTVCALWFLYSLMLPVSLAFLIEFGGGLIEQNTPTLQPQAEMEFPQTPVLAGDPVSPNVGDTWINTDLNQLRIRIDETTTMGMRLLASGGISQEYRIGEYVSMVFWLGLVFAVAFQLPLVLMLTSWIGILEPRDITPYRRQVIFGCGVAGAIFTPQDPWSMVFLGGALYLLFEFGIVLMRFVPADRIAGAKKARNAAPKTDANEGDE